MSDANVHLENVLAGDVPNASPGFHRMFIEAGVIKLKNSSGGVSSGSTDADAIHDNAANEISALTDKPVPVAGDLLIIEDSAAGFVKKKVSIGNLPGGGGGGVTEYTLTTNNATPTTIHTFDASTADRIYKVAFDLQAVLADGPDEDNTAFYRVMAQFKNEGGTVSELRFQFVVLEEGTNFTALDVVATISGTDILFQVQGLAATDIKWLMEVQPDTTPIAVTFTP